MSRIFLVMLLISGAGVLGASPWAIVTDFGDATIHTIDLGTNPPTVYGPFLNGQIIPQTQLGAVKVLPGSRFAFLAGAFSNMYLLNITDPAVPFVAVNRGWGGVESGVAVSRDGSFVVLASETSAGFVKLPELTLGGCTLSARLSSAALATNNTTVILGDYLNNRLIYGEVKPTFDCIDPVNTIATVSAPTKVAIAQDGKTVLAGGTAVNDEVRVFLLTPGGLVPGTPPRLEVGAQSFAFEPNGNRVYALSWGATISILRVVAPGEVSVERLNAVTVPTYIIPGYPKAVDIPGIDMMAITPDGQRLVVGDSLDTYVHIIQLSDLSLSAINTGGKYPTGIDVFEGVTPVPTTTPTSSPTTTPTPTMTPTTVIQVAVPTLSSEMLIFLASILAVLALHLLRRA